MNKNKFYPFRTLKSSDFMLVQGFWGYKKSNCTSIFNSFILGIKNSLYILKSDFFLEYLNRSSVFCVKSILNKSNIVFLVPAKHDVATREFIFYFSIRCLQSFCLNKKTIFQLKNNNRRRSYITILPYTTKQKLSLKDFYTNLISFICVEDSDFSYRTYSCIGNNDSMHFTYFFYKFISYYILKAMFLFLFKDT